MRSRASFLHLRLLASQANNYSIVDRVETRCGGNATEDLARFSENFALGVTYVNQALTLRACGHGRRNRHAYVHALLEACTAAGPCVKMFSSKQLGYKNLAQNLQPYEGVHDLDRLVTVLFSGSERV